MSPTTTCFFQGPGTEGTVPDLTEGKIYQFRVKAVNKAGPSEPSDSTGQHLCKARYREWTNVTEGIIIDQIHCRGMSLQYVIVSLPNAFYLYVASGASPPFKLNLPSPQ